MSVCPASCSKPSLPFWMLYAGVLQGLVPFLWGPGACVQYNAARAMLNIARNESSFDAITTAGVCIEGMPCDAAPYCKL